MKVQVISQLAGADNAADVINTGLASNDYNRFRFLAAFARWSGLHLLDHELQTFANRKGRIEGVVGVDLGGTTAEALTYLFELPHSKIKIFRSGNPRVVFHPKVYILEGPEKWLAIVGSSNLTSGGLYSNAEVSLVITGRKSETNTALASWDKYFNCRAPLSPSHVQLLDETLLQSLAGSLDSYRDRPPDAAKSSKNGIPALPLVAPLPPVGRPPAPKKPSASTAGAQVPNLVSPPGGKGELYMELWGETGGSGGTQVQISTEAFENFFGATPHTVTWIDLKTPTAAAKERLQQFPNNTYRIPLPFVASVRRPAVLRFVRTGPDAYTVSVAPVGSRSYKAWLAKCTTQTRAGSKRYGIY